jgi:hypothetical protein
MVSAAHTPACDRQVTSTSIHMAKPGPAIWHSLAVTHRYKRAHCLWLEPFQIADYAGMVRRLVPSAAGVRNVHLCFARQQYWDKRIPALIENSDGHRPAHGLAMPCAGALVSPPGYSSPQLRRHGTAAVAWPANPLARRFVSPA